MATELEAKRLRRRVGYAVDDTVSMPLADVNELFDEAGVRYTNPASIEVYAAIVYLEGLLVNSAKMTSYKKNMTTENAGDLFKHVRDLITYYQDDLLAVELGVEALEGAVRSGKTTHRVRSNSVYWWEAEI